MKFEACILWTSSSCIYLDMTGIDKSAWTGRLSDMREELLDYIKVDIAEKPFAIEPGIHYFMGGIRVDNDHRTNIDNLYAAGECACKYHGANRLGGNSLLGAIYGGKVIGSRLVQDDNNELKETDNDYQKLNDSYSEKIRDILLSGLGIVRNKDGISDAIEKINQLLMENLKEVQFAKTILAKAMLISALDRKESRGAHYREDYPETDESFRKTAVASYDGDIRIEYVDLDGGKAR
ncbi:MAG: FAD-binding protein [Erysipelotrichaceae bacterium]|nr:FAD-binding protein [Erysipelotrichaceae bacterium]